MTSPPKPSSHPIRSLLKQLPVYAAFKQLGHHPDYWWWKLRGQPRRIPHLLKQRTVLEYAQAFGLTTLVETGTYYGEMVAAVERRFQRIYSIELDPRLANLARKRFQNNPRVEIIEGDSQTAVPHAAATSQPEMFMVAGRGLLWMGGPNRQQQPTEHRTHRDS